MRAPQESIIEEPDIKKAKQRVAKGTSSQTTESIAEDETNETGTRDRMFLDDWDLLANQVAAAVGGLAYQTQQGDPMIELL